MTTPRSRFDFSARPACRLTGAIGTGALMLLLVTLPLAHVTALRSVAFVVACACAGVVWLGASEPRSRALPLLWIFLVWLVAALLSLTSSANVPPALAAIANEVGKGALVFYAAYILARNRQSGQYFFAAAVALALLAALSLASWFETQTWQANGLVPSLGDYNTSALTLLPLIALPAFASWRERLGAASLPVAALTTVLAAAAAAVSLSRSFWLVAAVMFVVPTLVWFGKKHRQWKTAIVWIATALCLLALLATLVARWRGLDLLFFGSRSAIYGPVFERLFDAPWTGFGYGHETSQDWYLAKRMDTGVFHAHNVVLSYAEQMGLPGVLAILSIFGGLAAAFFRRIADANPYRASLAAVGLALVAGVFVKNNLDIFFTRHNLVLFFLCAGLLLGSTDAEGTRPLPLEPARQ